MNKNSRILPHLNQMYAQKKSYEIHKQKISLIRKSINNSRYSHQIKDINSSFSYAHLVERQRKQYSQSRTNKTAIRSCKIIQEINNTSRVKKCNVSPLVRNKQFQIEKQNQKLFHRLNSSISLIMSRNAMVKRFRQLNALKNRICKFDSFSDDKNVVQLKSEKTYKKIQFNHKLDQERMKIKHQNLQKIKNKKSERFKTDFLKSKIQISTPIKIFKSSGQINHALTLNEKKMKFEQQKRQRSKTIQNSQKIPRTFYKRQQILRNRIEEKINQPKFNNHLLNKIDRQNKQQNNYTINKNVNMGKKNNSQNDIMKYSNANVRQKQKINQEKIQNNENTYFATELINEQQQISKDNKNIMNKKNDTIKINNKQQTEKQNKNVQKLISNDNEIVQDFNIIQE